MQEPKPIADLPLHPANVICGRCRNQFMPTNDNVEVSSLAPIVKITCPKCRARTNVQCGDYYNTFADENPKDPLGFLPAFLELSKIIGDNHRETLAEIGALRICLDGLNKAFAALVEKTTPAISTPTVEPPPKRAKGVCGCCGAIFEYGKHSVEINETHQIAIISCPMCAVSTTVPAKAVAK